MKLKNFNINKFVDETIAEGDKVKERKESFSKQVKNLLKLFDSNSKHVLRYFPLEYFEYAQIEKFLTHLFNLKYDVSSKVIAELDKISVDKELKFLKIEGGNLHNNGILDKQNQNRRIIRKFPMEIKQLYENNKSIREIGLSKGENFNFISDYVEYITDGILQLINYWIVCNPNLKDDDKNICLGNIEKIINNWDKILHNETESKKMNMEKNGCDLLIESAINNYFEFLTKRNYFYEYIKILQNLEKEEKDEANLFGEVQEQYKALKIKYTDEKIKEILTEGMNVEDYNLKLKETKETIEFFSNYGDRAVKSDCLQDLKVYFREIFISKSKYKLQARTIVREYLKEYHENKVVKPFKKKSEYMFVREKISRGHFRENNILKYYNEKNKLQRQLYYTILNVYHFYDYEKSVNVLYSLNANILRKIVKLFHIDL